MTDTLRSDPKVRIWGQPFFKPALGVLLVVVLLVADEFYGCITGEGCSVGIFTIIGPVVVAVSLYIWSRMDPEGPRSWVLVVTLAGVFIAVFGLSNGPAIRVLPSVSPTKISAEIDQTADQVNIIVQLNFEPSQFHRETISAFGVFSGTDRDDRSKLRLVAVDPSDLSKIANIFWVKEIITFVR